MLRPENNMHHGHIHLDTIIPEGYYTVRAYSSYANNQKEDYFFKKQIRIGNILDQQTAISNPAKKKEDNDFDVSFFPEGGNLLVGELCKIAFKALNSDGISINLSGDIIEEEGSTPISSLQTNHNEMEIN